MGQKRQHRLPVTVLKALCGGNKNVGGEQECGVEEEEERPSHSGVDHLWGLWGGRPVMDIVNTKFKRFEISSCI